MPSRDSIPPCSWKKGSEVPQRAPLGGRIQERHHLTPEVIRAMWDEGGADCNVGIATGKQSGLFVVDVDMKGAGVARNERALLAKLGMDRWPPTIVVKTANDGSHVYFQNPDSGLVLASGSGMLAFGVDHRGENGYVVGPGSAVNGGRRYYIKGLDELSPMPPELLHLLARLQVSPAPHQDLEVTDMPVGKHATFTDLWAEVGVQAKPGEHDYRCPFHDDRKPSLSINTHKSVGSVGLIARVVTGLSGGKFDQAWHHLVHATNPIPRTAAVLRQCEDLLAKAVEVGRTGSDVEGLCRAPRSRLEPRGSGNRCIP